MYKLSCNASKQANYIYHMLSVAKVGYDNSYGEKFRAFHNNDDLTFLKDNERDLTVSGGEHCGKLYGLLVAKPASSKTISAMRKYYESLKFLFTSQDIELTIKNFSDIGDDFLDSSLTGWDEAYMQCFNTYNVESKKIIKLSNIFIENIEIYVNQIWLKVENELQRYERDLAYRLEKEGNLITKWENQLNTTFNEKQFEIILCNSLEKGAQGIDITKTKDVFNINEDIDNLVGFISHEIGIYIILQSIPNEIKMNMQKYWLCIESLASYHNQKVLFENEMMFAKDNIYFNKFDKFYEANRKIDFKDIIEMAVN